MLDVESAKKRALDCAKKSIPYMLLEVQAETLGAVGGSITIGSPRERAIYNKWVLGTRAEIAKLEVRDARS